MDAVVLALTSASRAPHSSSATSSPARPVGRPLLTYAETVRKATLRTTCIELDRWYELTQDRLRWRAALRHLTSPDKTSKTQRLRQQLCFVLALR
jgi:hypothetical protein